MTETLLGILLTALGFTGLGFMSGAHLMWLRWNRESESIQN